MMFVLPTELSELFWHNCVEADDDVLVPDCAIVAKLSAVDIVAEIGIELWLVTKTEDRRCLKI